MAVFDEGFQRRLASQSWALYGVGIFIIFFRIFARVHRVGFRELAADDYLMLLAAAWYTVLVVCLNVIAGGGGSNLFLPEDYAFFTKEDIENRIAGSKVVVVSEQGMLNVIYTLKICLLIMYGRLTTGVAQYRLVKFLFIYVGIGWVATEVTFFTACRPFSGYWAMPPPSPQCATLQYYAIVQACFNLSSDVGILIIPIPMITKLNMPLRQRLILGVVFSMGIFVILAAILTKVYNLSDVYDTSYMLWYTREASVAVYVANLPMIWPLLREWFPCLRKLSTGKNYAAERRPSAYYGDGTRLRSRPGSQPHRTTLRDLKLSSHLHTFPKANSADAFAKGDVELGIKSVGTMRSGSPASSELALNPGDIRADVTIEVARESTEDIGRNGQSGGRQATGMSKGDALTWTHATATGPMTETSISGPERFER
ncbi:uncharacterized protein BKCO1_8500015 [Diplodia corticola]|uniref:Rhodopsin domain-containing protein n=1 Tax=Diplodia corticola TaxID=236234 RepID=A0A1J9QK98_9PEZI|nr:uncharacterized protein BKCO1_8500015 [Diplodia corticola]OJD29286.1 hypothetical protein BKCO1_8500015 [Diplodia corticola]